MSKRIVFVNLPAKDYSSLDLGLTTLATYINKETAHSAAICDLIWHRRDWRQFLATELTRESPDYVGVSANKLLLPLARQVVDEAHRLGYPVVVGGHQTSVDPGGTLLATQADYACTGDGETSLVPFLDGQGHCGQRIWRGHFYTNLEALPPPDYGLWHHLDRYIYLLGSLYAIGSRGCPYACQFCDAPGIQQSVGGRYFRLMHPRHYAWMLAGLAGRYRPPLLQLFDPVLSVNPDWVDTFCAEYGSYNTGVPFSAFARIDHLDERRLKALAWAGCRILRVGIEAGNEYIRREVYKKDISTQRIREVVALCKQHGIALTSYLILGGPGETPATVRESLQLARELDCERQVFFLYKVLSSAGQRQAEGCGAHIRSGADNITFGAQLDLPGLPAWRTQLFQAEGYGYTLSRRLVRLLRTQRTAYFRNVLTYLVKAAYWGLDLKYAVAYSQVYAGENALM